MAGYIAGCADLVVMAIASALVARQLWHERHRCWGTLLGRNQENRRG